MRRCFPDDLITVGRPTPGVTEYVVDTDGKLDLKNLPLPEIFRGQGESAQTKAEEDFCQVFPGPSA